MIVPAMDDSIKEYYGDNFISFRYIDEVTGVACFRDEKGNINEELIYDENDNPNIIEIPDYILKSFGVKI